MALQLTNEWDKVFPKSTKVGNKELYIVEGASHVDLYDNLDKIPFDKIENFLKESLEV